MRLSELLETMQKEGFQFTSVAGYTRGKYMREKDCSLEEALNYYQSGRKVRFHLKSEDKYCDIEACKRRTGLDSPDPVINEKGDYLLCVGQVRKIPGNEPMSWPIYFVAIYCEEHDLPLRTIQAQLTPTQALKTNFLI